MKRKLNKRSVALLVCLAVILTATVGVTLAYIFTNTNALQNIFTPAQVSCAVVEEGVTNPVTGNQVSVSEKKNVQIKNTGNTDAYIRVAVVVTWKSTTDNSTVLAQKPVAGTDYTIEYNTTLTNGVGWVLGEDGYYYYTKEVAPDGGLTGILINSCAPVAGKTPEGYVLSVEIVASAIQSSPDDVVGDQWSNEKVTIIGEDGTLSVTKED